MDSIRPDEDELRARAPTAGEDRKAGQGGRTRGRRAADEGSGKPPVARPGEQDPGRGRGLLWLVLILLLVALAGAGWFGWQMQQKVLAMEEVLEEADYWSRQSKLALARFEGELSETGESLEQTGSSMAQRLRDIDEALAGTEDEIRKLWVLANEKNRPRIEALAEKQESLAGEVETLTGELSATGESVDEVHGRVGDLDDSLEQTRQRQSETEERVQTVESDVEGMDERLADMEEALGGVEEDVEQRLTRFRQEQSLTLDGLESRIESLERGGGQAEQLAQQLSDTRARLEEAEQTLESVDASRAQLTSRVVRLQEQVDELRAQ